MTFNNAAWAINGPIIDASLARRAQFAATGGNEGITQSGDLKVTQLSVPGSGLLISAGVGSVLNRYQTTPSETYVVSNPTPHTVTSGEMPGSNPSAKSYIVAVVVGDPDFSQVGHPWMPTTIPTGTEAEFVYTRVTLIAVSSGATALNVNYPALALARIDVPASTATITNAMITDLRKLAQPRYSKDLKVSPAGAWRSSIRLAPTVGYSDWGSLEFAPSTAVPSWATRAIVICTVNSIVLDDNSVNIMGNMRTKLGGIAGGNTFFNFEIQPSGGAERINLQTASEYDVTSIAGTTVAVRLNAYQDTPASPTNDQKLALRAGSQMIFDINFFEE